MALNRSVPPLPKAQLHCHTPLPKGAEWMVIRDNAGSTGSLRGGKPTGREVVQVLEAQRLEATCPRSPALANSLGAGRRGAGDCALCLGSWGLFGTLWPWRGWGALKGTRR